ncbi:hypothetical protein ACHAXS_002125 [Conticribra weissflogii]
MSRDSNLFDEFRRDSSIYGGRNLAGAARNIIKILIIWYSLVRISSKLSRSLCRGRSLT